MHNQHQKSLATQWLVYLSARPTPPEVAEQKHRHMSGGSLFELFFVAEKIEQMGIVNNTFSISTIMRHNEWCAIYSY